MSPHKPVPDSDLSHRIKVSTELIADLCMLQQNAEDALEQDGNTDEERQMLQRILRDARHGEKEARHRLEVLTRTVGHRRQKSRRPVKDGQLRVR
jgi:hypothetical protein